LPSRIPTGQPSSSPSAYPSSEPSSCPTSIPSFYPTGYPTGKPSSYPSNYPSSIPSSQPTSVPSELLSGDRILKCFSSCTYDGSPASGTWLASEYCSFFHSTGCKTEDIATFACVPACLKACPDVFCSSFSKMAFFCGSDNTSNEAKQNVLFGACAESFANSSATKTEIQFQVHVYFSGFNISAFTADKGAQDATASEIVRGMNLRRGFDIVFALRSFLSVRRLLDGDIAAVVSYNISVIIEELGYRSSDSKVAFDDVTNNFREYIRSSAMLRGIRARGLSLFGTSLFEDSAVSISQVSFSSFSVNVLDAPSTEKTENTLLTVIIVASSITSACFIMGLCAVLFWKTRGEKSSSKVHVYELRNKEDDFDHNKVVPDISMLKHSGIHSGGSAKVVPANWTDELLKKYLSAESSFRVRQKPLSESIFGVDNEFFQDEIEIDLGESKQNAQDGNDIQSRIIDPVLAQAEALPPEEQHHYRRRRSSVRRHSVRRQSERRNSRREDTADKKGEFRSSTLNPNPPGVQYPPSPSGSLRTYHLPETINEESSVEDQDSSVALENSSLGDDGSVYTIPQGFGFSQNDDVQPVSDKDQRHRRRELRRKTRAVIQLDEAQIISFSPSPPLSTLPPLRVPIETANRAAWKESTNEIEDSVNAVFDVTQAGHGKPRRLPHASKSRRRAPGESYSP
jgi:hypothetical protein